MFNNVQRVAIKTLCERFGVPLEWALGLAEVESAGRAFWTIDGRSLPAIRQEGHYFYKYLPEAKRPGAVQRGLAHKNAGAINVPGSYRGRYELLDTWMQIDRTAALMSISMGVGQVMGSHYERLGFKTVEEMWDVARSSLAGQVELMLRYIVTDPVLLAAVKANKYARVAKLYNGPNYRQNKYDTKIAAAVTRYRRGTSTENRFAEEYAMLNKLGYKTVEAFQLAAGIVPDGIIGPITIEKLRDATAEAAAKPASKATEIAVVIGTGGAAVTAIEKVTQTVDAAKPVIETVKSLGLGGSQVFIVLGTAILAAGAVYVTMQIVRTLRKAA